jgi:HlyD family secretion protein
MNIAGLKSLGALLLVSSVALSACSAQPQQVSPSAVASTGDASATAVSATPAPRRAIETGPRVVADGYAVPVETGTARFDTSGIIAEVLVKEGDVVKAGDALARLDTRELQLVVEEAQAELVRAQVGYQALQAGAPKEEIAKHQAALEKAQAGLRQAQGSVTQADIKAAQESVTAARAALDELQRGAKPEDIKIAEAAIAEDRANLQTTRDRLSAEKSRARSRLDQYANYLRDLQAEYSRIYWQNQGDKADRQLEQAELDEEAAALRAVENGQAALSQALLEYEEAFKAEVTGIAAAESRLQDSQERLTKLKRGADPDELVAARARLTTSEAYLSKLRGELRAGELESAQADVAYAEADLAAIMSQPNASDLAIAEAQLRVAEVAVKQADLALARATMIAPINGVVAEVNFHPGDITSAAQVVIADYSTWRVVTRNLTEIGVVRIREGDPAKVNFYALPGLELAGKVVEIHRIGQTEGNSEVAYEVIVELDQGDERLRWNLTASISIDASS